jgi:hypothetical protein
MSELRLADELETWPHLPRPALVARLAAVVTELYGAYQELAGSLAEERKAKVGGWHGSGAERVSERERDAESAALAASMSVFELRGRVYALEAARDFGYRLLTPNLE